MSVGKFLSHEQMECQTLPNTSGMVTPVENRKSRAIMDTAQLRMRRRLGESVGIPLWPEGVHPGTFSESRAANAHALLQLAYATGGGAVGPFEDWWRLLSSDREYSPELCFPVYAGGEAIVAFAQCWTSAFVKDFAVHPDWQRRGIGRALLLHIFCVFQKKDALAVDLKVEADNSGAIQFYQSLGMIHVPN